MHLINPYRTIIRNFISFQPSDIKLTVYNEKIFNLIKFLAERNTFLSEPLVMHLLYDYDLEKVDSIIEALTQQKAGKFLNITFATSNSLEEGDFLIDHFQQINEYFSTAFKFDLITIKADRSIYFSDDYFNLGKNAPRYIGYKTISEFKEFVSNMVSMPIVFGDEQELFIDLAFENKCLIIPDKIKVKENLFHLIKYMHPSAVCKYLNTANDIMRFALYVTNDTPVSRINMKNFKFKLSTSNKKKIMQALNALPFKQAYNDMYPKRSLWLSLGVNLYPGASNFNKYPVAQKLFNFLRDNTDLKNRYNHKLGEARKNDFRTYIEMISDKPGLMVRGLDEIIRNSTKEEFSFFLKKLSSLELNPKLIIDQINRLKWRVENEVNIRHVNIGSKIIKVEKPLLKLKNRRVRSVVKILEDFLINSFSGKDLFNVNSISLNENLKKYIVPTELRDNSRTDNGMIFTSGTRIKLPEDIKFLRVFVAWGVKGDYNEKEFHHFDIDHSLLALHNDDGEEKFSHVSYYNQKEAYAVSSGDRTQCHAFNPEKDSLMVAEFIDIDVEKCTQAHIEQLIMSNYIFTSGHFDNHFNEVHAYTGIIFLNDLRQEESMTIDLKDAFWRIKLSGNFNSHVPFSLDLINKEIVVIDQYHVTSGGSNIERIANDVVMFKEKYLNSVLTKYNMYDLIKMYCEENGILIVDKEADLDLSIDNISQYLESIVNILK